MPKSQRNFFIFLWIYLIIYIIINFSKEHGNLLNLQPLFSPLLISPDPETLKKSYTYVFICILFTCFLVKSKDFLFVNGWPRWIWINMMNMNEYMKKWMRVFGIPTSHVVYKNYFLMLRHKIAFPNQCLDTVFLYLENLFKRFLVAKNPD